MRCFMVSLLCSVGVSRIRAACPGACSGHGRCGNYASQRSAASSTLPGHGVPDALLDTFGANPLVDKKDSCTCFTRVEEGLTVYDFTGPDCSLRTCPQAPSWSAVYADNDHTLYEECSGRGTCHRKSGRCDCFPGYSGSACQRTACPNECSDHGTCQTLAAIAQGLSESSAYATLAAFDATKIRYSAAWDAHQTTGCLCDDGFFGPDCSQKRCPSQRDPMGGPGSETGRECSGRGRCNHGDGECRCYNGYYGAACATQRNSLLSI